MKKWRTSVRSQVSKQDPPAYEAGETYLNPQLSLPPVSLDFLLGLLFHPEDGGDMFLRYIRLPPNYKASQLRRPYPL
jgi:hypothetical protein